MYFVVVYEGINFIFFHFFALFFLSDAKHTRAVSAVPLAWRLMVATPSAGLLASFSSAKSVWPTRSGCCGGQSIDKCVWREDFRGERINSWMGVILSGRAEYFRSYTKCSVMMVRLQRFLDYVFSSNL